jgi:hypothetical protein
MIFGWVTELVTNWRCSGNRTADPFEGSGYSLLSMKKNGVHGLQLQGEARKAETCQMISFQTAYERSSFVKRCWPVLM